MYFMRWRNYLIPLCVVVVSFLLFLFYQAQGIYGGDSGDLVTAAYEFGVPHPPGYPLYTWLVWLATRIPLFTPAWRGGLVSSIPHAITLGFVYLFVRGLGGSLASGIFAVLMLGGNYLFFLYSTTPEVFALFDLFVISAVYLLFLWHETHKLGFLYLFFLVFGLSLTHHHVMLFLVPSILYFLYNNYKRYNYYTYYILLLLFLLGLLPYLYIPLAARGAAIVNWDRAIDLPGFIRLLTRQDYGSFVANGFYGSLPIHRIIQVKAYGQFLLLDMTWLGILLALMGGFTLWRQQRQRFWFVLLALLLLGPGFFFYASFPLMNRFSLGTYERFLLPSYTLLAVVMGMGFDQSVRLIRRATPGVRMNLSGIAGILLFLLPAIIGAGTLWRFWGLQADRTADALGKDVMAGIPNGAILLVSRDTPLFASQYVRYALGWRPDIFLIHANRLWSEDYPDTLRLRFPGIIVPQSDPGTFAKTLVAKNRDTTSIYSNTTITLDDGWFWVPYGLVYKLTRKDDLPTMAAFIEQNDKLWDSFHDPRSGILSRYNHLMLSDVLSVYADSRITAGKILLKGGKLNDAKRYFRDAIDFRSDIEEQDGFTYLGLAELFDGNCTEALSAFAQARQASLVPDDSLMLYESVAHKDACADPEKALELMRLYEASRRKDEIPLGIK